MTVSYCVEVLIEDIIRFHTMLEESNIPVEAGIRDMSLLESAVNSPFQTFSGQDLFPSFFEKAARLLYGLTKNHAFVDGNKRVAVHAMEMFLLLNGIQLFFTDEEMEEFVIQVANGESSYEDVCNWITAHVKNE